MNANELADWIERQGNDGAGNMHSQIAAMLRQQQAEIEALKAKTLTDEEILDVEKRLRNNGDFCELHFAKAILKKASEK